jgi:hypothetical protein
MLRSSTFTRNASHPSAASGTRTQSTTCSALRPPHEPALVRSGQLIGSSLNAYCAQQQVPFCGLVAIKLTIWRQPDSRRFSRIVDSIIRMCPISRNREKNRAIGVMFAVAQTDAAQARIISRRPLEARSHEPHPPPFPIFPVAAGLRADCDLEPAHSQLFGRQRSNRHASSCCNANSCCNADSRCNANSCRGGNGKR